MAKDGAPTPPLKGKRALRNRISVLSSRDDMHRMIHWLSLSAALLLAGCAKDRVHSMIVSVPEQRMALFRKGELLKVYDVSTSKFGLGSVRGSNCTPLGRHEIAKKIGGGQPSGMKFKSRRPTGEIVPVNSPGRDPIVTRILWLKGLEQHNKNSFARTIYIHGTPEEWRIGTPASYGCVRMRSSDIIELYRIVGVGARVDIVNTVLDLPGENTPPLSPPRTLIAATPAASPR